MKTRPLADICSQARCCNVWPDIKDGLLAELEELDALLKANASLLKDADPDLVRLQSLAAVLHSFNTVYEGIFKQILKAGGRLPVDDGQWHSAVLSAMREAPENADGILDQEQYLALRECLRFRHVFRQGYLLKLNWEKMRPLVQSLSPLHAALRNKICARL